MVEMRKINQPTGANKVQLYYLQRVQNNQKQQMVGVTWPQVR